MSDTTEQRVPEGATIYELTSELVNLLTQPEMQDLRSLLSDKGAKVLLAQLGAMTPQELMALRARLCPPVAAHRPPPT